MRLHVGNLSWKATEDDVRQAFEVYGTVERVILPPSNIREGENRGFAIVRMSDLEGSVALEHAGGAVIRGRAIHVEEAPPQRFKER